ncbi:Molybdenum cofactor guanylyltransferase [Rosistilla oblonga]|uniref:molybdenum cofactor guanylyltransferase n=1 Tax=Rosistilla oblonga TaxID=2527990 RepID=UPI001188F457|nr:molybdenum cofactor guanylyltransferase [Rosistilla oblonga]QDV10353.1 Molybdenum cofactor guanylyltransferase [Rosistilla oblonga]
MTIHSSQTTQRPSLLGAILAGGRSSRMGSSKAMLPMPTGTTLLEHVDACLTPYCRSIVVSVAPSQQLTTSLPTVPDTGASQGPASGIASVLQLANQQGFAAAMIVSVDLPALTSTDLAPLITAWEADPDRIAAATADGQFSEPLVAIYPATYLEQLTAVACGTDRSIMRWLRRTPHQTITIRREAIQDVDTPEQWNAYHDREVRKNARPSDR